MTKSLRSCRRGGSSSFSDGERGSAAMELLLGLPILALVMLLLIGLGYTLMAKPRAVVAARYVAQHGIVHESPPSPAVVAAAVGERGERWSVSLSGGGADGESVGELERESRNAESGVAGVFGSFLNALSGRSRYVATAASRPRRGIVPRLMQIGEARGTYITEHDPWNCEKNRGSYLTIVTSGASSSLGSVPMLGELVNALDGVTRNLPCCETYKER